MCLRECVLYQSVTLFVRLGLGEVRLAPGLHQSVARAALHRTALCTQTLTPTYTNTSQKQITHFIVHITELNKI